MLESMTGAARFARAGVRCAERGIRVVLAVCAAATLAACGGQDRSETLAPSASVMSRPAEPTTAAAAARSPGSSAESAPDSELLARGEILSFACRPCHGLAPGDESPVGPHLAGLFGRRAASVEGFEYSVALRESGIVWTPETLDAWLAQPETFLPGNDMDFAGFRLAEDRHALIAYLREQTTPDETSSSAAAVEEASD